MPFTVTGASPGHAQQFGLVGPVHVHRKALGMSPGPEFLGIDVQRQVAGAVEAISSREAVFAQEVVVW
jgi:hypothetical protein